MAMLEVTSLGISFGGLRAVDELSMKIEQGGLVGLIGPNGAGKTTVFNMLTGVYRPTDGGIRLDGQNLVGKKPHEICRLGVARTFQNIRLFTAQSVLDNVKAALHNRITYSLAESMLHLGSYRRKEKEMDEEAMRILSLSGWRLLQEIWPPTFPTASSASWRSPAPLPRIPSFFCWMSPPQA